MTTLIIADPRNIFQPARLSFLKIDAHRTFRLFLHEYFQLRTLLYILCGCVSAFLNVFKQAQSFKTMTRIVASIVVQPLRATTFLAVQFRILS